MNSIDHEPNHSVGGVKRFSCYGVKRLMVHGPCDNDSKSMPMFRLFTNSKHKNQSPKVRLIGLFFYKPYN